MSPECGFVFGRKYASEVARQMPGEIESSRNMGVDELEGWEWKGRRRILEAVCCRYSESVNGYTCCCDGESERTEPKLRETAFRPVSHSLVIVGLV